MRVLPLSRFLLLAVLLLAAAGASAARRTFDADFLVRFEPERGTALVTLTTRNRDGRASRFDFAMPADRYSDVVGDGEVVRAGDRVVWTPPAAGGALRWRYTIDKRRRDGGYDARITDDWSIVRGDHLFPGARVRMTPDTDSRSRLRVELPEGWSTVSTPWKAARDGESFVVVNPETRFDRPTGWMIAGDIGNRVERHEDIEIAVAAPKGDAMPRQEILAMVGWTLPEMRMIFGELPPRIVIVGAGDPMWRGGLSGQRSLYMHSARPLISENGTSTLLHELVHLITRISGRDGHKYISEGLAEFYSIELLHRTGGTTDARHQRTVDMLKRWGRGVERLTGQRSRGPVTARAVILFMALDKEIRDATDDEKSLDDVTRLLMAKRRVDTDDLVEAATAVLGRKPDTLDTTLIR
jgi:hypothetical protein